MNQQLLLEYSRELVKKQFEKFFQSKEKEILTAFDSIDDFLETLEEIDPEGGSEYVRILLTLYKRGALEIEHIYLVKTAMKTLLAKYASLIKRKKYPSNKIKLDQIRNIYDFDKFRSTVEEIYNKLELESDHKEKGQGKLWYTGNYRTKFYESFDKEHACYIGRGSLWCTATTTTMNYFETYKQYGYRVITIIPDRSVRFVDREKYQTNIRSFLDEAYLTSTMTDYPIFTYLNKSISLYELYQTQPKVYKDFIDFMFNIILPEEVENYLSHNRVFKNIIGRKTELEHVFLNRAKQVYEQQKDKLVGRIGSTRTYYPGLYVNLDEFNVPDMIKNYAKSLFNFLKTNNIKTINEFYNEIKNRPNEAIASYTNIFEGYLYLYLINNKKTVKESLNAKPLLKQLMKLRKEMAAAAQKEYDEWQGEDDPELGCGGICDIISNAIAYVINTNLEKVNTIEGSQEGDDHSWIIAYDDNEAYGVDICPYIYETGCGYKWTKLKGVRFKESDIDIFEIKDFDRNYLDK